MSLAGGDTVVLPGRCHHIMEGLICVGFTVHQADLDLEEKILRHFDLSSQYGVCHM